MQCVEAVGQIDHVGRPGQVELIVEVAVGQRAVDVDLERGHEGRQDTRPGQGSR